MPTMKKIMATLSLSKTRDLELELKASTLIVEKCKDGRYAQNLYAALCNMQWQPTEVVPILKEELWSCTWRYAGGLIAEIREQGDYMDWYCSGIGGIDDIVDLYNGVDKGFVPESSVTDEIRQDLQTLGWHPVPWKD